MVVANSIGELNGDVLKTKNIDVAYNSLLYTVTVIPAQKTVADLKIYYTVGQL
jgi:hypothetical protein